MNSESLHSDMLMKLLAFLLLHREQALSVEVLSEALWNEGETDNPAGALKNLMYRLRTILNQTLGKEEYILTSRGIYSWNSEIAVQVDVEEFEKLCEKAQRETEITKKRKYLEKALSLYQGEFLTRIMDRHWVMTLSTYYHSRITGVVKLLSDLNMKEGQYRKVEQLCLFGLKQDPVDEWMYCMLIRSFLQQGQKKLAMQYYQNAVRTLREELGIERSTQLNQVYEELMHNARSGGAEKIENVQEDVMEKEIPSGAYICGYPVFCEIYKIEARRIGRLGEAEYLALFTLHLKDKKTLEEQPKLGQFIMEKAMNQFERILEEVLRVGDVAARYSDSQFVVLLPTCTFESCQVVTGRIRERFEKEDKGKHVSISVDCEAVKDTKTLMNGQVKL